jgi:hypothetical protein
VTDLSIREIGLAIAFGFSAGAGATFGYWCLSSARDFLAGILEARHGAMCVCGHGDTRHAPKGERHCRICGARDCPTFREDDPD